MRYLLATLIAVLTLSTPAFAQVTEVTVDNTVPTNAAGARTVYLVDFKTQAALAEGQWIRATFPAGTGFTGWTGGTIRDVAAGQDMGSCATPSNGTVQCSLYSGRSIAGGRAVRLTIEGVTNPGTFDQHQVRVSTQTDPAEAPSAPFATVTAGELTEITLDNSAPTRAAGGRTNYVARFKLSATGGMSAQANSRIDITFPPLTGYLNWNGGVVRDVTEGTDVGACSSPSNGAIQCYLFSGRSIDPGATVQVTLAGITNTTETGTDKIVRVDTTSDPALLPSQPFTVLAANPVTAVSAQNTTPTNAAGARTRYLVGFTLSATGGLSEDANSRIDVTFPAGTTFVGWNGGTVRVAGGDVGACSSPSGVTVQCWLYSDRTLPAGAAVTIAFDGVTNSTTPGANKTVTVATSSDPPAVASTPFSVVPAGAVSAVTAANGSPSAAAGARTRYVVGFTLSATGAISAAANSRIGVTFPAGTTFAGWNGGVVSAGGTNVGACSSASGLTIECWLFTDRSVAAGADVTIVFNGITNSGAPGAGKTVAVSTTSDPGAIASPPFAVVPGGSVSGVSVALGSLAPSARTDYVVRLTTSATGALAEDANSRLTFTFPAGTTFADWNGAVIHDLTRGLDVGACSSPSGTAVECWLYSDRTVSANTALRVTFHDVTNPPSAGPHRLTVATTSDTPAVTSPEYSQGEVQPPPPPAVASEQTGEFTFSSTQPGVSFECSLDDAPFSACTSPARYDGLAPGSHTFRVRAVEAGVPGPATAHPFTVAPPLEATPTPAPQPAPVPTAAPTPAPAPEFKQDVVVAPVSGTVEVCAKPGVKCTALAAGAAIPMGSTIDARKGVVELTSLSAPGAPPQKARFSEGMFRVSQAGAYTDLTLNEPLDCSKRKARAAQKRKPKSRKLWGDGKGKFRTKGQYSAATIRGTKWLVQDTCTTTVTKVAQGVVSVRDTVKRKTVTVRAGKSYTARAKR
jgi:hypothetical protein